jgi:malate dehydrogenase (oxaloacetate-decarboxylating)(NADP+)
MFNDDVQGTGAVIVGGFINAIKASGTPVKDHKAIFLGAGSAGTGVAKQIVEYFKKEGLTEGPSQVLVCRLQRSRHIGSWRQAR